MTRPQSIYAVAHHHLLLAIHMFFILQLSCRMLYKRTSSRYQLSQSSDTFKISKKLSASVGLTNKHDFLHILHSLAEYMIYV